MGIKPLSSEGNKKIADWGDKVIRDAVKNNQLMPTSVYEAPEVLQARINYTVGQIVNFALNVAHEEWNEARAEQPSRTCPHPSYNEAGNCAEIACNNYAGKHV